MAGRRPFNQPSQRLIFRRPAQVFKASNRSVKGMEHTQMKHLVLITLLSLTACGSSNGAKSVTSLPGSSNGVYNYVAPEVPAQLTNELSGRFGVSAAYLPIGNPITALQYTMVQSPECQQYDFNLQGWLVSFDPLTHKNLVGIYSVPDPNDLHDYTYTNGVYDMYGLGQFEILNAPSWVTAINPNEYVLHWMGTNCYARLTDSITW